MSGSLNNAQQHTINISGVQYVINMKEFESFVQECQTFMDVEANGFETMTQIISDQLIESAPPRTTIEELRPQLKFMKEVGLFLKGVLTPVREEL